MNRDLTFAITVVMLVALMAPAALARSDGFSGGFSYGPPAGGENGEIIENQWTQQGVSFDDPRLDGRVTLTANSDQLDEDGLYRYSFRIETDEGAWQGEPVAGFTFDDGTYATSVHLLTGEGAYEGLVSVAEVGNDGHSFSVRGRIVEGPFPEL